MIHTRADETFPLTSLGFPQQCLVDDPIPGRCDSLADLDLSIGITDRFPSVQAAQIVDLPPPIAEDAKRVRW